MYGSERTITCRVLTRDGNVENKSGTRRCATKMSGQIRTAGNVKYFGILVRTTCSLVDRYRGFGRTAVSIMTKGREDGRWFHRNDAIRLPDHADLCSKII
jgi:hypothetical protein